MSAEERGAALGLAEVASPRTPDALALQARADWDAYGSQERGARGRHMLTFAHAYIRAAGILQTGPALVGIDGQAHGDPVEGGFWAHAADVSLWRWNGWAVPLFTREEVERLRSQMSAHNEALSAADLEDMGALVLTWDGDTLCEWDPHYPEEPATRQEPGTLPDGTQVWTVGDGWCWSEVEMVEIPAECAAVLA